MQPVTLRGVLLLALSLFAGTVLADRPVTRTSELNDLADRLRAERRAQQGPEYQRLMSLRTGYWGELHADPTRQLMGVDKDGEPIIYYTCNVNAAHTTRVDELHPGGASGYDRDGSGIWGVAVWDNGVADPNHQEFLGHVMIGDNGANYEAHANHTCGTVAATGINSNAKGMAFGALLSSFDWDQDRIEMAENADWVRISSHSYHYGSGYGTYDGSTADIDEIMYLAPYYLACYAATNDGPGYGTIYSSSLGKNALTVGATHDVDNYTGPGSVSIAGFSSRGPAEDGRLKPDVVGNGVNLYSTLANNNYTYMSGTSMSTPNVAGTSFVILEHYMLTHDYMAPLSSTLKAILIHTADECGPTDGPDYTYGWGLVNAWAAADLISADEASPGIIAEHELANGGSYSETVEASGDEPLRVTLAWIDPPAAPYSNPSLIHDLDVEVVRVSDGQHFFAWVMNPASPADPAGTGDNDVDNVEQVYIADPEPGEYEIHVSHEGTLTDPSQWFSLIVTGTASDEPVQLSLSAANTEIGEEGGTLEYAVSLVNSTDTAYPGQTFWTSALLPNGNEYGPLFTSQSFTLQAGADINVSSLTQTIPGWAPTGTYQLIGRVGEWPDVWLQDGFEFTKGLATAVDDPGADTWEAGGRWQPDGSTRGSSVEMPAEERLTAWPNPFNSTTQVTVRLDAPAAVQLSVVNVLGREVRRMTDSRYPAGVHSIGLQGDDLPSGMYLVRLSLDGTPVAFRKLMLMK